MSGPKGRESQDIKEAMGQGPKPPESPKPSVGMEDIVIIEDEGDTKVSEAEAEQQKTITKDLITSGNIDLLLNVVDTLVKEGGREETIKLMLGTLEDFVNEGGEKATLAQQTIDQIKAKVPLNEKELLDNLFALTEKTEGMYAIADQFESYKQAANFPAMQAMMKMLEATKGQPGVHGEVAQLALDRIAVFSLKEKPFEEFLAQAMAQNSTKMASRGPESVTSSPDVAAESVAQVEQAQVEPTAAIPETEEEKLARKEMTRKANAELEKALDENLKVATELAVRTDKMVETGTFDTAMSFDQIATAKRDYKKRLEAKANEKVSEEAAKLAETRKKTITGDPELDKLFTSTSEASPATPEKPPLVAVNQVRPENLKPVTPDEIQKAPKKVDAVTDVSPPKPEARVSKPATPEATPPEVPAKVDPAKVTITDSELKARLDAEAKQKPKGGIRVNKNPVDSLDGFDG